MTHSSPLPPAVILAAGRGNRLLPLTKDRPKCLMEVGSHPVLVHQVRALEAAGVETIQIILGHGAGKVREACEPFNGRLQFGLNEHYDTTTSLYSLGCSTIEPNGRGLLILNSDVLFHPALMEKLVADPRPNVLLSDFRDTLGEEEMKILADGEGRITAISKTIDPAEAQAENLGVLKVERTVAERMLEMARHPEDHPTLCWVPDSIQALLEEFEFHALPTGEAPWVEIDYPHDLQHAREEIWPRIEPAFAR